MKRFSKLLLSLLLLATSAHAQTTTQNVTLVTGWNAVWLEVEPTAADGSLKPPQDVFNNPAVATIATPKPLASLSEYFGSAPGAISTFNQDEWQRWKRTDPADANNLPLIFGNRPYLIQCTAPVSLAITGTVRFFRPKWTPDRYNLLGFGISGAPTFQNFFGASAGKHPLNKIFRLTAAGDWQSVAATDPMIAGQAYWIFSDGPSTYMGPVAVDFTHATTGTLNFGGPDDAVPVGTGVDLLELDLEELVFTNLGSTSAVPALDLTALDPGVGSLLLHVVRPTTNSLGYERAGQVDTTVGGGASSALGETVLAGKSSVLTLGAGQRTWASGQRTNLYRLTTGAGSAFWLPISALKSSLTQPATAVPSAVESTAGLWIGDVKVNAVTSIVVDGAPVQPAAGSVPLRLLLHSDDSGGVQLLSQVTIMQTKSSDPSVPPVPVLVVDQAKIPFFEGIKERGGKRVGVRVEAANYDMPRKLDGASQAALLSDPIYTGPNLADFLNSRSTRPPSLAEKYHLTWPITGTLGAGNTVSTTTALTLDPFHRSNPFRHAFHQNEPRGPQISRTMTVVFDNQQTVSDRLRGTYTETITGLTKTNLTLTGPIELRRVSTVSTLDTAP